MMKQQDCPAKAAEAHKTSARVLGKRLARCWGFPWNCPAGHDASSGAFLLTLPASTGFRVNGEDWGKSRKNLGGGSRQ